MATWIKNNLVLVSGIVLPVLLVAGFFLLSRAPQMLADPPRYDFVVVGFEYNYQQPGDYYLSFEVRDGHLTGRAIPNPENTGNSYRRQATIFRYRVSEDRFEELVFDLPEDVETIEEPVALDLSSAAGLSLDKRSTAPDGYIFEYRGSRGSGGLLGELFGMNHRYGSDYVLSRDGAFFDLPRPAPEASYYYNELQFMGWVVGAGDTP